MEETKKSRNDQRGNNKLVIKLGCGGGVVGVVVLLGGALATAAFASAFVLGQKRRSSDKDNRGRRQNSSPEIDEKSEKEHEHISKGAKEVVESENDSTVVISAQSLKVDVEAISDDGFVIVKPSSEIPFLAEKGENEKVQLIIKEDDYSKESTNVDIEDESAERESHGDGKTGRKEAAEVTEMQPREEDNGVVGYQIDDKHINMEKKKKEFIVFCNGNGEINEEKTVNGCLVHLSSQNILPLQFDAKNNVEKEELISPEDVETVKHGEQNEEAPQNLELNENGGALVQHPHSQPDEDDIKRATEEEVEQELVDHGDGKATVSSNMANGEVPNKDGDEDAAERAEVMRKTSSVHTSGVVMDYGLDRKGDPSKWEALWQVEWPNKASSVAPQRVKLVSYEVGGKVGEDKAVVNKYAVEMGMVKDHQMGLRIVVWALCVVSSLACSWFFDLSVAKLCLVVFLTVFLLEIYGYPLLNRQCLHAAKGGEKVPNE